jgi:hypothetical protein
MANIIQKYQHPIISLFHPPASSHTWKKFHFSLLNRLRNVNPDRFKRRWPEPVADEAILIPP